MKTILILLTLATVSCTTSTTTNPDGSVTVAKSIDNDALKTGTNATLFLVDRYSGK